MVVIKVEKVSKRYNHTAAVKRCDLQVHSGEILALLGPSGSGKTTLLRLIAGFERPDEGRILIGERTVVDVAGSIWVPAEARGVGMVFQDYALFPHLTVTENIQFGLRGINNESARIAFKNYCGRPSCCRMRNDIPTNYRGGNNSELLWRAP